MDEPKFRLSEAAAVTGWPLTTLRDYFAKGLFAWQDSDAAPQLAGSPALLSLRSVVRLAIARELWLCCSSPKEAFNAAWAFTDIGSGSQYADAPRVPGELFPAPLHTILVFRPGHSTAVVPVEDGPVTDLDQLMRDPFPTSGAAIVLDVGPIVEKVRKALAESKAQQ